jgi:hypothetical protein
MKTLARGECTAWLRERGVHEDPYNVRCSASFYEQVSLPAEPLRKRAVVQQLLSACGCDEPVLLVFTYWEPWGDAMAVLGGVRSRSGDDRPLIESPGHVFGAEERALLLGLFSVAMFYGFSVYLYLPDGTTLLGWEGEMLDMWTSDEGRFNDAQVLFNKLGLERHPADA